MGFRQTGTISMCLISGTVPDRDCDLDREGEPEQRHPMSRETMFRKQMAPTHARSLSREAERQRRRSIEAFGNGARSFVQGIAAGGKVA